MLRPCLLRPQALQKKLANLSPRGSPGSLFDVGFRWRCSDFLSTDMQQGLS